ncbi:C4-dicarboxylate transporter DctA, partial [Klebsiella michiganensis]|nr:C4-dicarboxylate transporter DctA [Klebsiella michiganensis]
MIIQSIPDGQPIAARKPFYRHLYFQVLVAIALGVTIGHFWPSVGESFKPLGEGF